MRGFGKGLVLALVVLTGVACGDDDDDDTPASGGTGAGSGGGSGSGSGGGGSGMGGSGGGTSGTGGGGPGTVDSGLDGTTALSALSDAQRMQLCERTAAAAEGTFTDEGLQSFACTLTAAVLAADLDANGDVVIDLAGCEQEFQSCVATPGESSTMVDCDDDELTGQLMTCDATVADFEACMNAALALFDRLFEDFVCENLDDPMLAGMILADPTDTLPECGTITTQCPELLETATGMSGGGEPAANGCTDTCSDAMDGACDDGGPDSLTSICALGTDCTDCGQR